MRRGGADSGGECPTRRVAVLGAGAAGTLTAIHLALTHARSRPSHRLDVLLVDPADRGRLAVSPTPRPTTGTSSTSRPPGCPRCPTSRTTSSTGCAAPPAPTRAPATSRDAATSGGTSRRPWSRRSLTPTASPVVPPTRSGRHPDDAQRTGRHRSVRWWPASRRHRRAGARASSRRAPPGRRARCATRRGSSPTPGRPALSTPSRPIGDVLLVGTGLTAVDVALTLDQAGRTLHMVSRRGRLPAVHTSGGCATAGPAVETARRSGRRAACRPRRPA